MALVGNSSFFGVDVPGRKQKMPAQEETLPIKKMEETTTEPKAKIQKTKIEQAKEGAETEHETKQIR